MSVVPTQELIDRLVSAALVERAAEQACRNRPWEDRRAWMQYVEALTARREAVDALLRARR